jgi:box C/D snoRNA protein 1
MTGLRNKAFVEYPTIDIWEQGCFTGTLVEVDGTSVASDEDLRPVKRRRLDAVGGHKLITSLLGGYTSNEEDPEEESNVMNMLGGYCSDEESLKAASVEEGQHSEEDDSVMLEEPTLEDVRDLLESVGHDSFTEDQITWKDEAEEEEVDWGDSTDDEAELWKALQQPNASHQPTSM